MAIVSRRARFVHNVLYITLTDEKEATTPYNVREVPIHPDIGTAPAFELTSFPGGKIGPVYHVYNGQFGWTCDCCDFDHRSGNTKSGCKHISAMAVVGIIRDERHAEIVKGEDQ